MKNKTAKNIWSALGGVLVLLAATFLPLAGPPAAQAALNDWAPLDLGAQVQTGWNFVGTFDFTNLVNTVTNAYNSAFNTAFPRPLSATVNFPHNYRINRVSVHILAACATSAGATGAVLDFGDSTLTNRFFSVSCGTNTGTGVLTTNLNSVPGLIGYPSGTNGGSWSLGTQSNMLYTVGTNLLFYLRVTNDVNTAITSGRFEVYLHGYELNKANGLY